MKFKDLLEKAKAEGSFDDVIEQGDFRLRIERANGKTTQKGDPSIGAQFKVVGGGSGGSGVFEDLAEDDPALGTQGWVNLNFSEKAANISLRQLKSWGIPDEFLETADDAGAVAAVLPGIELDASVSHRAWGANNENLSMNIKVHNVLVPPALAGVEAVDPTDDQPVDAEVVDPY